MTGAGNPHHCDTCTCEPAKKKPAGCVCNEADWFIPIPSVCGSFMRWDDRIVGTCDSCEHEAGCHRAPEVST